MRVSPILLLTTACAGGPPSSAVAAAPGAHPGLELHLALSTRPFSPGETVEAELVLSNRSDTTVTIRFSSGQRFELVLRTERGDTVWRWSADRAFIDALGEERLGPGNTLRHREEFPAPEGPGRYRLEGRITSPDVAALAVADLIVR